MARVTITIEDTSDGGTPDILVFTQREPKADANPDEQALLADLAAHVAVTAISHACVASGGSTESVPLN